MRKFIQTTEANGIQISLPQRRRRQIEQFDFYSIFLFFFLTSFLYAKKYSWNILSKNTIRTDIENVIFFPVVFIVSIDSDDTLSDFCQQIS